MKLSDVIKNKAIKASIVEDCTQLVDEQVKAKGGLSGVALKTAYSVVKGIGANYIPGAIGRLLPEVCKALDPIWAEGQATGNPVAYLTEHKAKTADMVLQITDARAANSNTAVRSAYNKLRKSVQGDVEAAVPGLATILGKHMQSVQPAA